MTLAVESYADIAAIARARSNTFDWWVPSRVACHGCHDRGWVLAGSEWDDAARRHVPQWAKCSDCGQSSRRNEPT